MWTYVKIWSEIMLNRKFALTQIGRYEPIHQRLQQNVGWSSEYSILSVILTKDDLGTAFHVSWQRRSWGWNPWKLKGFITMETVYFCYWCSMIYGSSHTSKSEKEQITKSVIDSHSPSKGTWHREWTETALDVREFRVCRVCPCDGFRRGCLRTWGILGFFKRNCEKLWEMIGEESWHNYGIIMWKYWMIIGE